MTKDKLKEETFITAIRCGYDTETFRLVDMDEYEARNLTPEDQKERKRLLFEEKLAAARYKHSVEIKSLRAQKGSAGSKCFDCSKTELTLWRKTATEEKLLCKKCKGRYVFSYTTGELEKES